MRRPWKQGCRFLRGGGGGCRLTACRYPHITARKYYAFLTLLGEHAVLFAKKIYFPILILLAVSLIRNGWAFL